MAKKDKTEIKFEVSLDQKQIPEKITWEADDSPKKGKHPCKSIMIALWDEEEKNTMRIDLWTKQMKVDEMKYFYFQTLMTMADSYKNATNEEELAKKMQKFAQEFALEAGIAEEKET